MRQRAAYAIRLTAIGYSRQTCECRFDDFLGQGHAIAWTRKHEEKRSARDGTQRRARRTRSRTVPSRLHLYRCRRRGRCRWRSCSLAVRRPDEPGSGYAGSGFHPCRCLAGLCGIGDHSDVARGAGLHKNFSKKHLNKILSTYVENNIEIRSCKNIKKLCPISKLAKESDWFQEYLAPIISIKIVNSLDEAIMHITKYGSLHTDAIISNDNSSIDKFKKLVNSSSVMVNTSTRFADGYEYGLGAEIGISTDKLHARGPVGLDGLTNLKYVVTSKGKIRD